MLVARHLNIMPLSYAVIKWDRTRFFYVTSSDRHILPGSCKRFLVTIATERWYANPTRAGIPISCGNFGAGFSWSMPDRWECANDEKWTRVRRFATQPPLLVPVRALLFHLVRSVSRHALSFTLWRLLTPNCERGYLANTTSQRYRIHVLI